MVPATPQSRPKAKRAVLTEDSPGRNADHMVARAVQKLLYHLIMEIIHE